LAAQDWMDKDFYATLGVAKDADDAAIKKAYRKLARKYHPDQNPDDKSAEAKFKDIGEAYSVISDKKQRAEYDQIRAYAGGMPRFQAAPGGGSSGFEDIFGSMFTNGYPTTSTRSRPSARYANDSYEDIMRDFGDFDSVFGSQPGRNFGGGSYGTRTRFASPKKGADITATVDLSFREAVEGITEKLQVNGNEITTRIPAGVNDGQKVRLRGKGRPGTNGGDAGDLVLSLRVAKHPVFSLDGRNIRVTVPVTFPEAANGAEIEVPTPVGGPVKVRIPAGTPSGRVLRVKGKGAQATKGAGDLLVKVEVQVPKNLNDKAKEALNAYAAAVGDTDVRANLVADAAR
jgi:molecular chaperone DnaJ